MVVLLLTSRVERSGTEGAAQGVYSVSQGMASVVHDGCQLS